MDRHRSYLATICRICAEGIASAKKYSVESVAHIVDAAYKDKDGCDISIDNADTESTFVCERCYRMLRRWNNDRMKFLENNRKNPNSNKEFSSSLKLPPSIEHRLVHLVVGCPCSAGQVDDTEEMVAVVGTELHTCKSRYCARQLSDQMCIAQLINNCQQINGPPT